MDPCSTDTCSHVRRVSGDKGDRNEAQSLTTYYCTPRRTGIKTSFRPSPHVTREFIRLSKLIEYREETVRENNRTLLQLQERIEAYEAKWQERLMKDVVGCDRLVRSYTLSRSFVTDRYGM